MDDLLKRDATDQIAALTAKRVSAVELLSAALARHDEVHGQINAVVALSRERAMEHAAAIDELRMRGEPQGPLAGLPMTVKDTLDVVALPASSGLKHLRTRLREYDAGPLVVKKRGTAVEPEQLRKQLKLTGAREVTVVLTRAAGKQIAMVVQPLGL